ncbi:hypothetical protein [Haloparvum sedimenti]|uniref:hypothetical protein n=1 Tax=Haloparvum sedimenti TaxID=1678448 RepID=UPI00071E7BD3|nr:hypothetical protein [Haloparvum sedimenti]
MDSPTQVLPDRNLALRTLERPVDAEGFADTVAASLDERDSETVVMYLDALDKLIADAGGESTIAALERLRDDLPPSGVVVCGIDADAVDRATFERFGGLADEVVVDHSESNVGRAVERLRRADPTNFGYARRHWREARRGIERCERNYPKAKQIHRRLADPATTPRTLGATLKAFVDLGIIDVWSDTVGPTRYDLTVYDAGRLLEVGEALDAND